MYTDEALTKLLGSSNRDIEESDVKRALWEFSTKAGYTVNSVELSFALGESRFFNINFQDEYQAALFAMTFSPLAEDEPLLVATNASVAIEVK